MILRCMCENVYTLTHVVVVLQFGCAELTIGFDFQFNCLNIVPLNVPTSLLIVLLLFFIYP